MADSRVAELKAKPGAWVDLGLTLPIFVLYHLGVVFLGVKNGTDFLTGYLMQLSEGSTPKDPSRRRCSPPPTEPTSAKRSTSVAVTATSAMRRRRR